MSTPAELDDYSRYIYSKEGRAELVKCAKKYGVLRGIHDITYTAVMDYITTHMGYYRHSGRKISPTAATTMTLSALSRRRRKNNEA